eukprot:4367692-Karenia_brevis.AAC.1
MVAQPISNIEAPGAIQAGHGRDNIAAGSGPSGAERTMQGVGPPPRATAGIRPCGAALFGHPPSGDTTGHWLTHG